MSTGRLTLAALVLVSGGVWASVFGAAGADVPAAPPAVRLDAIVTDANGRPLLDLHPSDFEITDSGDIRPVESAVLQSDREGRLLAIFLDEYHIQAGENTARARAALTQFVDRDLRPNDLVAIMKPLDPLNAIQVTRNRDALLAAIQGIEGRKGDYTPRTPFEQNFISRAPATADTSRAQVVSSALQALALRVGSVREGRKSVVLVSEGFTPALPRGSDRLMGGVRAIVYAANRYAVAFYAIDPRVPVDANDAERATAALQTLADQTGGGTSINQANLMPGLTQAAGNLDSYYLLTYSPARAGDGTFHPVQVRVKRPGVRIRIRSGYWATIPTPLQPAGLDSRAAVVPMRLARSSPLIRPWVGAEQGADGHTRVTVTWEPGAAPPRNQRIGAVILKATSDAGQVLFEAPVALRAAFDAPPGRIQLEMTIQGGDGKPLDSDFRTFEVPNLRVVRTTFAAAQVVRTRSAREFALASAEASIAPVASREFSRAERLLIRVPVYTANDVTPTVTATLMNRLGTPMRALGLVPSALPKTLVQFDLPLASLAPDEYRVELAATASGQEVKSLILFRVTN